MKRFAFLLVAIAFCVSAGAQEISDDTTFITVAAGGRRIAIPLVSKHERGMVFAMHRLFIEHGVTYLYREYSYYQCDTCKGYHVDTSSYYIRPKEWKGYLQYVHDHTWWNQQNEEYADAYRYLREKCPMERLQLGDAPRMWYPVVRYRGQYYISIDNLNAIELTDSIVFYHDMEVAISALRSFSKDGEGSYSWQEESGYSDGIDHITIRPARHVQDLYVMTTVHSESGTVEYQLVTPEKNIHNFDFIDWKSTDHIPEGLTYETVDFERL